MIRHDALAAVERRGISLIARARVAVQPRSRLVAIDYKREPIRLANQLLKHRRGRS